MAGGGKVCAQPENCSWRAEQLLLAKKLFRGYFEKLSCCCFFFLVGAEARCR